MTHGCFFIAPKNLPVFSTFSIEFNSWQDEEEASVAIENFRLKTWVYFSGSWSNKSTWLTFFVSIIIWFVKLYYFSISVLLVLRNVAHYEKGALFDTWLLGQKKRPFHRGLQSPSRTSSFHLMVGVEKNRLSLVQSGKEPNQKLDGKIPVFCGRTWTWLLLCYTKLPTIFGVPISCGFLLVLLKCRKIGSNLGFLGQFMSPNRLWVWVTHSASKIQKYGKTQICERALLTSHVTCVLKPF